MSEPVSPRIPVLAKYRVTLHFSDGMVLYRETNAYSDHEAASEITNTASFETGYESRVWYSRSSLVKYEVAKIG